MGSGAFLFSGGYGGGGETGGDRDRDAEEGSGGFLLRNRSWTQSYQ
uniref:Uncharacterized protein n=1 Tax=Lotus japonicus TaxID=34305 RepID=I3S2E1_LOTJA|nr:unknown [Lotus japonicus]